MARDRDTLFDIGKARGGRPAPTVGGDAGPPGEDAPWTVSRLVRCIKDALAEAMPKRVTVVGEISNFKRHTSGHLYFRLKDADATIDAVMFKASASGLKFELEDGLEVVAEGRVDVYDVRGQLQFYVDRLTPKGAGELDLAFRQLREKLRKEGLFDPAKKKPLRRFPRAVGIVTSATGAAVRDIGRTLARRWPAARVYLMPVVVQGEGAAQQIAEAVGLLDANADALRIDTLIVGRGGGSLEDLWAFNEEIVARAIFAARTPVISGVGHEVDVTIADLVSDVRAATPTAAAELAVPDRDEVGRHVGTLADRLSREVAGPVRTYAQRIDELSHRLRGSLAAVVSGARRRLEGPAARLAARHPQWLVERARSDLDGIVARLRWALGGRSKGLGEALSAVAARLLAGHPRHRAQLARQRVIAAARQLEALSYRNVLKRGYSVTRTAGGNVMRSAADARPGDALETELHDGRVTSRVDGTGSGPRERRRRSSGGDPPGLFDHSG